MSFFKLRLILLNFENRVSQLINSINGFGPHQPLPALACNIDTISPELARLQNADRGQTRDVKAALDWDGILWKMCSKKRRSWERRQKRRDGEHFVRRYKTPKKGIITCLACGGWYQTHTICGGCYAKVREETDRMKEAMGYEKFHFNIPSQEVEYVYKNEKTNETFGKRSKYVVEMENDRPTWWNKHLLTKSNE